MEMKNLNSSDEDVAPPWNSNIRINHMVVNDNGLSNEITTTKYNIFSWLPKSLWEQFRRIANVYFLGISVLMLIGTYATYIFSTPLEPFSTVMTLMFVLLVTSVKEGLEDLERARSDKEENTRKATVVTFEDDGTIVEDVIDTQYIKGGDIVKLSGHCSVPVDMLLMVTSLYADGNQCYVETANIDGETNLKLKEAPPGIRVLIPDDGAISLKLFSGNIEFEAPNKNIHNFVGALHLDHMDAALPLGAENLLLRSSLFSNTDWAYGIAVYTGQETKIQMNNRHAPSKMSKIEQYVNKAIILIFFAQLILVTVAIISLYALGYNKTSDFPYLYPNGNDRTSQLPEWLELWLVFFILFNNFIPISLYVTIELVNLGQAYLIQSDIEIYDEALNCPTSVRSSNLAQELGLVSNVFSDKTGTLTRNEMVFVKFIVNNRMYDVKQGLSGINDDSLSDPNSPVYKFLFCLTTCHTIIREKNGTYRAESPDELALVEGVDAFKCCLLERGTASMLVELFGKRVKYEVLAVNAFTSDRKRMSILLHDHETDQYFLMCKGADNIMLERCKLNQGELANIEKSLLDLACIGLRTLCVARKVLSAAEATAWIEEWKQAATSLQDRVGMLAEAAENIEKNMELLGITAIEDRLQDEVPEVIADLARAGIVLWMLTGDKEETAINIGHSCNLLTPDTKEFFLTRISSPQEYARKLQETCQDVEKLKETESNVEVGLVMDGPSFKHFDEASSEQRNWLLRIGQKCRSVIACRLTPLQKQQVVNIVKVDTKPRATTLSIGDGANDVSMIREADVGVGIFGKEGRQAANNADFAIGQFKFLRRLLLVHGRWNYCRQSRVFLYSMHKNLVITLTLFWFSYLAAVSGTSMYESWIYSGYNFALGLPIIFYGILDQDIPARFSLTHPEVYATGLCNRFLNMASIGKWIFNAMLFATVFCLLFFSVVKQYDSYGLYEMGTMVYVGLVLSLQLKVVFLHHIWTKIHSISMAISILGLFLVLYILNAPTEDNYDFYYVVNFLYAQDPLFWFWGFFTVPFCCLLVDVIGHSLYVVFFPREEMIYREAAFSGSSSLCGVEAIQSQVSNLHASKETSNISTQVKDRNSDSNTVKTQQAKM